MHLQETQGWFIHWSDDYSFVIKFNDGIIFIKWMEALPKLELPSLELRRKSLNLSHCSLIEKFANLWLSQEAI